MGKGAEIGGDGSDLGYVPNDAIIGRETDIKIRLGKILNTSSQPSLLKKCSP